LDDFAPMSSCRVWLEWLIPVGNIPRFLFNSLFIAINSSAPIKPADKLWFISFASRRSVDSRLILMVEIFRRDGVLSRDRYPWTQTIIINTKHNLRCINNHNIDISIVHSVQQISIVIAIQKEAIRRYHLNDLKHPNHSQTRLPRIWGINITEVGYGSRFRVSAKAAIAMRRGPFLTNCGFCRHSHLVE